MASSPTETPSAVDQFVARLTSSPLNIHDSREECVTTAMYDDLKKNERFAKLAPKTAAGQPLVTEENVGEVCRKVMIAGLKLQEKAPKGESTRLDFFYEGYAGEMGYKPILANAVALRHAIEDAALGNPNVPHPVPIPVALVPLPKFKQEVPTAAPSDIADAAFVNGYHEWKAGTPPTINYPQLSNAEIDHALGACVGRDVNATLLKCRFVGREILARQVNGKY